MANKKRKLPSSRFPDAPGAASRHKKQKQGQNGATRGGAGAGGGGGQQAGNPARGQQGKAKGKKGGHQQRHANQEPVIPFEPHENILLIGEADLSFAASLATHYGCRNLTATVLEKSETGLLEKYPHAGGNIARVLRPEQTEDKKVGGDDRSGEELESDNESEEDAEEQGAEEDSDDASSPGRNRNRNRNRQRQRQRSQNQPNRNRILYNTDAKTLKAFTTKPPRPDPTESRASPSAPRKQGPVKAAPAPPKKEGLFRRIIFNFPHVGGKSTDVNRQVRHNQSLLVSFFERALPSLAPGGSVIVTLFEGEPYTLWNVRDLARYAGLGVETSFRFPWGSYPGYRHARTLGIVKRRKHGAKKSDKGAEADGGEVGDGEDEGEGEGEGEGDENGDDEWEESTSAWKGEERAARSYVFKRKDEVGIPEPGSGKNKKNKKKQGGAKSGPSLDSDSDSDSE